MQQEHILLGAAVAVVVAAGLVDLLAPGAFATPDELGREDYGPIFQAAFNLALLLLALAGLSVLARRRLDTA